MMYRNRIGISRPYAVLSTTLCILWLVAVSQNELWTFSQHVRGCGWPDEALELQVCSILVIRVYGGHLRILSGLIAANLTAVWALRICYLSQTHRSSTHIRIQDDIHGSFG